MPVNRTLKSMYREDLDKFYQWVSTVEPVIDFTMGMAHEAHMKVVAENTKRGGEAHLYKMPDLLLEILADEEHPLRYELALLTITRLRRTNAAKTESAKKARFDYLFNNLIFNED